MSATDRSELEGFEGLVSELRAAPPVAPERLRQRVLDAPSARRPRRLTLPRRRLVFVLVPAAAALAVGAALVHGVVSSGSNRQATFAEAQVLGPVTSQGKVPSNRKVAPAMPATTVASGSAAQNTPQAPTAAKSTVVIPKNRLVHAAASLQVQVANRSALSRATNRATQIVASLGGYAQSVHYQSSHHGDGAAVLALRVPVQKAQVAIAKLGSLGTLLSQQVSTQDLQQQLTHQTNQIGSLRRSIAVYEQALQSGTLSASQRVEIQIKLANSRHALTQLRKARTGTLTSAATADVSLTLTTKQHGAIVPPPRGRFDRLLGSAAGFLALEGIIVLYALVVLGPVLVVGGITWAILRGRRRRDERRLLAST